jgi:nicotinate-nucleotide pyrophosphorylase
MMMLSIHIEPAIDVLFSKNHLEIVQIWREYLFWYREMLPVKTKIEIENQLLESMSGELNFPIDQHPSFLLLYSQSE